MTDSLKVTLTGMDEPLVGSEADEVIVTDGPETLVTVQLKVSVASTARPSRTVTLTA